MMTKLINFFWFSLTIGILGVLFTLGVIIYFSLSLPNIATLADYNPPIISQILSKDGTILAEFSKEKREITLMEDIPQIIIDAFLSAEDDRFYQHSGIDYMGMLRALMADIKAGGFVQGGSTITQQVAKSLLLSSERSITRKIKDVLLAQQIEKKFTKDEILFLYLNQVYLGGSYYGIKMAFRGYFNKEISEATIAEAAIIAGLLVAPTKYSPYKHPAFAKKRQRYVLRRMHTTKKITKEEYDNALAEKIKYFRRKKSSFMAGHFTDWVRQRVIKHVGNTNFLTNGFKVVTTLDWELQQKAEKEIKAGVIAIDKRQGFKGPVKRLKDEDEIIQYEIESQKKHLSKKSSFFTVDNDNEKIDEFIFNDEEFYAQKDYEDNWHNNNKKSKFFPGINQNTSSVFLTTLSKSQRIHAVVTGINNRARIIFISIGGTPGIIPYSGFRWAHERTITDEKKYFNYITHPGKILSKGDIILVEIKTLNSSLWDNLYKTEKAKLAKSKIKNSISNERYIECTLEQKPDVEAALVSIHPQSGEIIAFVGGSDFNKSQFNRALSSMRQPGSSFKPILYAAGLENNFTPSTILMDSPEALGGVDESLSWKPRNYDGKFKGPITFRNSLEQSRNIPTIKLAEEIGISKIINFVKRIGLNATLDHDLTLALGSFGVELLNLTATYAIFPNGGKIVKPFSIISIEDRNGDTFNINDDIDPYNNTSLNITNIDELNLGIDDEFKMLLGAYQDNDSYKEPIIPLKNKEINPYLLTLNETQVYDERLSYLMTNLLRGVILYGTGRQTKYISPFIGGKTGTTNNYIDALFMGFSSNVTTGVWTGFDNNKTMGWAESGSKAALPIWREYMTACIKKYGERDFKIPEGIVNVWINKNSGEPADVDSPHSFLESFIDGTEPGAEEEEIIIPETMAPSNYNNNSYDNDNSNSNKKLIQDNIKKSKTDIIFEDDDYYNNQ